MCNVSNLFWCGGLLLQNGELCCVFWAVILLSWDCCKCCCAWLCGYCCWCWRWCWWWPWCCHSCCWLWFSTKWKGLGIWLYKYFVRVFCVSSNESTIASFDYISFCNIAIFSLRKSNWLFSCSLFWWSERRLFYRIKKNRQILKSMPRVHSLRGSLTPTIQPLLRE